MKTIKSILMTGVAVLVAMTGCDSPIYPGGDNGNTDAKEGQGSVSFAQMSLSVKNSEIVIKSRAAATDVNSFTVNIKSANDRGSNQSFIYGEMPELVALEVGDYTVEAYNAEEQVAAFDAPYFYGTSNTFTVVPNDIVVVDPIVCKLSNVKVSVDYSDELRSRMSDVTVTVTVADNETLDYAGTETRAGYFKYVEGNKTIAATFNGKVDGFEVSDYKVITDAVAPGYHHTITFSLKDAPTPPDVFGGIGTTGLSMDATVERVDLNGDVTLNGGEEEIIEPDPAKEYLTVGATTLSFGCDAASQGVTVKASHEWTVESSAQWCTVAKTDGGFTVSASANSDPVNGREATITVTMNKLTSTITVSQEKYTEAPQGPVITSDNIDLNGTNSNTKFNESTPASINVEAPKGIKNFVVEITSDAAGFMAAINDLGLANFDLCNPGSVEESLASLQLPYGDQVKDQTSMVFDITTFMPMLTAFEGNHNFKITVTDNAGASTEVTIRIVVVK